MKPLKAYACYLENDEIRKSSSSGAIFSTLASHVLSSQGVVYGVAMSDDCYSAEYIAATNEDELKKLRGSKYLQAKVGDTFKRVKLDLSVGKTVLFSGTGCQVNGLKGFLGKEYDNLICVDVICHGVPSPALWRKYAEYQEERNGGKLKYVNFRCKDTSWIDFGMKEVLAALAEDSVKQNYIPKGKDAFMQMFLRDYCLRPSCYACQVKDNHGADWTIADFWGIDHAAPGMNDGKGTSLVLIRTEKGKRIFEALSEGLKVKEVSYEDGVKYNPAEYRSAARPSRRDFFFTDMHNLSFEQLTKKYAAPVKVPVKTKVKRGIKRFLCRFPYIARR